MATETASKKCAFSVMMLLLFLGGETLKLGSEDVSDEYDPRNHAVEDPEEVVRMFEMATRNSSLNRRKLNEGINCHIINPMDACWRCVKGGWRITRKRLASCALGFGLNAIGGLHGKYYYVTSNKDDDPVNPHPGTLRFGVIQTEPLWIVFKRDMTITLKQELIMNSYKTIDGRGRCVRIKYGAGITLQYIKHVIIIGLTISDTVQTGNAMVRSSPSHFGWRTIADGDAISIFGSSHIWIDHNTLSNCADGLVDVIMGSTAITISNNRFTHHNEVMLLGHSDDYVDDKFMQVTIAYNHFGEGLVQRMPRCRHGYFHVVNNEYNHWEMYAIGGSAQPTINSQGNLFLAPLDLNAKEVTKRVYAKQQDWSHWNWRSEGDLLLNGAYFIASGEQDSTVYARASSSSVIMPYSKVSSLIAHAGNTLCGNKRHKKHKKHKKHHPCL